MHCKIKIISLALVLISTAVFTGMASATEKLRFTTCEWEPYYGSNLMNNGYITEITKEAFRAAGYEIDVWFVPWNRALHDARNEHYDALLGLYHSEERAKWVEYSQPIESVKNVFFTLKDRIITYGSLKDLSAYRIGIERGYAYSDEFDSANYLRKEPARKIEININKLLKGRLDLVAASKMVFLHNMKKKFPEKMHLIDVLDKPLTVNKIYNGFVKKKSKHKKWTADFNRGLKIIKNNGLYDRILEKHGFTLN